MPYLRRSLPLALAHLLLVVLLPSAARADTHGVLRVGLVSLDLEPAADTPVVGGPVEDAVSAYNAAADAYNQVHGLDASSPMATSAIGRDALGVRADLVTLAPALEVGAGAYFFRLEGVVGLSDAVKTFGVGIYPVNLAAHLRRGTIVPYVSAGGRASWLDRARGDAEIGALLCARVAVGVRLARRLTLEVGYGAYSLGGVVDQGRLATMSDYDPRGDAPPPRPEAALAGGEQRGAIDLALGLAL